MFYVNAAELVFMHLCHFDCVFSVLSGRCAYQHLPTVRIASNIGHAADHAVVSTNAGGTASDVWGTWGNYRKILMIVAQFRRLHAVSNHECNSLDVTPNSCKLLYALFECPTSNSQ